jgi:cell division septation protein DedD
MMPPMAIPQESVPVTLEQTQPVATKPQEQVSQSAAPALPSLPASLLSFTSAPSVAAPATPALPVSPAQRQKSGGARRVWTVQVAAIAESSAAEALAQKLRQSGYDAYVRMTKSESKTWHRVRVGQLESQKDAADLRNILSAQKAHKDAYIAPY